MQGQDCFQRAAGVGRGSPAVDVTDDPLFVHHERHTLRHAKQA